MIIRPMAELRGSASQKRPKIRFFGPSDLEMNISGPMSLQTTRHLDSRQGLIDVGPEKNRFEFEPDYFVRPERAHTPGSAKSQTMIDITRWPLPPDDPEIETKIYNEERSKKSYSLFPTRAENVPRLPATVYDSRSTQDNSSISKLAARRFTRGESVTNVSDAFDYLSKPRPLFVERHNRNGSSDSSATVQIGLRFSVAPATLAAAKCTKIERNIEPAITRATPPNRSETMESDGSSPGLPIQLPSTTYTPAERIMYPNTDSPSPPHKTSTMRSRTDSPTRTPLTPLSPVLNSSAYLQAQREKVLPAPPPQSSVPALRIATSTVASKPDASGLSGLHMSPVASAASTVYSPNASTPDTPASVAITRSPSDRTAPSPGARIPLGAGTMSRSSSRTGWI